MIGFGAGDADGSLPSEPARPSTYIQAALQAIDTLSGGNTNPGDHPQARFTSLARQLSGSARAHFSGEPARRYIIEASTNLTDWEMIGVGAGEGGGSLGVWD